MEQMTFDMDPHEMVMTYHEETKHHLHRYARSPGSRAAGVRATGNRTYGMIT